MGGARVILQQQMQMRRKLRSPQHPFFCSAPPYCIQPFFIAPVMPGETMKNLMVQARVVSRPIKSSIIGWWTEFYFFYVKLRDLDDRDEFTKMLLDPEWDATVVSTNTPNQASTCYMSPGAGGGKMIDYVQKCLVTVIDEYFRDEGETAATHYVTLPALGGGVVQDYYVAQVSGNSVLDSAYTQAETATEDVAITVGADDQIRASEIELAMRQWEMLKQANLTTLSYEDFLAQYGITPKPEEVHRPELVRFVRDWTYPANTIDPTSGTPRSAVSWSISERADKDRFFREPGFLFGVWCTRPKVYLGAQAGTFTNALNDLYTWLPAGAGIAQEVSMKHLPDNVGPLPTLTDTGGYWFDVKDLYLYGEQFLGFQKANAATNAKWQSLSLPSVDLQNKKYPIAMADIQALFVDVATPFIDVDGIVNIQVASTIRETTPQGGPATDV